MSKVVDMSGRRYASLEGIRKVGNAMNGNAIWLFRCDCGNECQLDGYMVRTGRRTTCQKCAAERSRLASVKHGMSETPEFYTWTDIHTRCYNPKSTGYANYGGRGIKVCDRWRESFENFFADMGPRPSADHSIERENVNGDYDPSNCRWATLDEQANNKRTSRKITINGVTKNLKTWAKEFGLNQSTIAIRIKAGWSAEDLLKPSQHGGSVTFRGVTDTYQGWSERTGILASTIYRRINDYGWSIEESLTKGAKS